MPRPFRQVDVFTTTPYHGNPVAVVLEAPYVASQGGALGRAGRVHVTRDDEGQVWVGGGTVTCVIGDVAL